MHTISAGCVALTGRIIDLGQFFLLSTSELPRRRRRGACCPERQPATTIILDLTFIIALSNPPSYYLTRPTTAAPACGGSLAAAVGNTAATNCFKPFCLPPHHPAAPQGRRRLACSRDGGSWRHQPWRLPLIVALWLAEGPRFTPHAAWLSATAGGTRCRPHRTGCAAASPPRPSGWRSPARTLCGLRRRRRSRSPRLRRRQLGARP